MDYSIFRHVAQTAVVCQSLLPPGPIAGFIFEKRYFGDILSRFESAEAIQRTLTNNFIETLLDGLISVFVLAMMFLYSRQLALLEIASVVIYVALRNFAYLPLRRSMEEGAAVESIWYARDDADRGRRWRSPRSPLEPDHLLVIQSRCIAARPIGEMLSRKNECWRDSKL